MENLLRLYQDMNKNTWDYYNEINPNIKVLNPFISNANSAALHQQFIKNYFRLANKTDVLSQFDTNDILSDERAYHTNSVFFLGLLIREKTILKTRLFYEKRSKLNYPIFPFLWFLSVLFHDFGMEIEEKPSSYPIFNNLDDIRNNYNIKHDLLTAMPKGIDSDLFGLIERYFAYRKSDGKTDHGILAGIYLYDRLVTIRRLKWKYRNKELSWHYSLENKYALAAATIACHNMWTKNSMIEDVTDYKDAGLHYLIQPNFQLISLDSFPMLFLFGIADTIDPVKLYMRARNGGHQPETILKNIEFEFGKRWVKIQNKQNSPLDFQHMINQTRGLKGWINVNLKFEKDTIIIKFKS